MTCSFETCDRPIRSRNLCSGHYAQLNAGKELVPLRWRAKSGEPYSPVHGKAGTYTNHGCRCSHCTEAWNAACALRKRARVGLELPKDRDHGQETSYQWGCRCPLCTQAHTVHATEKRYMLKHGAVDTMRGAQNGKCACCFKPYGKLVVDHVHGTSHVRGLLCNACNTGIGKLGDDIEGVQRALDYLKRTTPKS
jgi:hypothetical protein